MRKHLVIDCATGEAAEMPFTSEEAAAADAAEAAEAIEAAKPKPPTVQEFLDALLDHATNKPGADERLAAINQRRK